MSRRWASSRPRPTPSPTSSRARRRRPSAHWAGSANPRDATWPGHPLRPPPTATDPAFRNAEPRERQAEAEAKATQVVSEAIAGGNNQALNYFIAQKYVEAVGKFATSPNAKTILFPVEATQLIGTLGGIGELARGALAGNTVPPPPAGKRPGPFEGPAQ